jgi:DhnA family fructose-bisphosphate aldolase class Ia
MPILAADGKALIVAMDHGRTHGVIAGLENPGRVIDAAVAGGADGVMTTFGVVKRYRDHLIGRIPTILRLDGGPTLYREDWLAYTEWTLMHSVEDALNLGVDAVVLMAFIGIPVEMETLRIVAKVAGECLQAKLPLVVEALPGKSARIPDDKAADVMASAARLGFEHGADLIKTYYTGTPEGFRQVVENCPVPVLIAGGPRMNTVADTLDVVEGALQAGASGLVFGRNIWQHHNPSALLRALRRMVHEQATAGEALAEVEPA